LPPIFPLPFLQVPLVHGLPYFVQYSNNLALLFVEETVLHGMTDMPILKGAMEWK
jgi:hypothetical protein